MNRDLIDRLKLLQDKVIIMSALEGPNATAKLTKDEVALLQEGFDALKRQLAGQGVPMPAKVAKLARQHGLRV